MLSIFWSKETDRFKNSFLCFLHIRTTISGFITVGDSRLITEMHDIEVRMCKKHRKEFLKRSVTLLQKIESIVDDGDKKVIERKKLYEDVDKVLKEINAS